MLIPALLALLLTPQVPQEASVELVEEHRIGSADGPLEEVFGAVSDVAADAEGNVYVLDQRADRVRVFDGSGSYLRTFGRRGRGAGELSRPIDIDLILDTITVLNPSGISNTYDLTGRLLSSGRLPFGAQAATRVGESLYVVLTDGGIARSGPRPVESLLLVRPGEVDTLLTVPSRDILYRGPAATSAIGTSLCGSVHWTAGAEDALWVASGVDGSLTEWSLADGAPEPVRSVDVAPSASPVPDAVRDELVGQLPRQLDPESGDLYVPSSLSSVCGLERSTDGTLWLRLADVDGQERWRTIDPETLTPRSELTVPPGVTIRAFSTDRAYGVEIDDARVTRVVAYRIE